MISLNDYINRLRINFNNFFGHLSKTRRSLLLTAIVVLVLPLTVFMALQVQDLRQRAEGLPATSATPPYPTDFGSALVVDSQNGHVTLSNTTGSINDSYNNLTIEAIIQYNTYNGAIQYPIISKHFSTGQTLPFNLLITPEGKLSFIYSVLNGNNVWVDSQIVSNSTLIPGKLYHVAAVYNNVQGSSQQGTLSLYTNGVRDAYIYQTGNIAGGSTGWISIGIQGSSYFSGLIDEVRISNEPRYVGNFSQVSPFENDSATLGLYHFDNSLLYSSDFHRDGNGSPVVYEPSFPSPFIFPMPSPSVSPSPSNWPSPSPSPSPTVKTAVFYPIAD